MKPMTHWMDSEYPKGEIVPYAGVYIEAPWTASGKNEIPTSNFESIVKRSLCRKTLFHG